MTTAESPLQPEVAEDLLGVRKILAVPSSVEHRLEGEDGASMGYLSRHVSRGALE